MSRTLQPDDRLAHYRVVGPLGAGGMGEVYVAQDQTLERSVALKVLPSGLVRNEERLRRFVTEAKSASSLSHPHIVTIYEIGQDRVRPGDDGEPEAGSDPVHFISMELVTGETLKDKIHHEKTDLRTLLGYLVQAAEGLAKAHASGIVHRDLKPSNIMISRDGYAKVLDFGLAKLTERENAGDDATSAATEIADRTGEGVVLGTVAYMSPEQVRGKSVDHRSDIFSFGCLLYESATRNRPFAADSDVETMHRILHQQPEALEDVAPDTPNALRRLIRRCLAKNPEARLQSMKDLAIELGEIVSEFETLTPSGSSSGVHSGVVEPARRRSAAGRWLGLVAVGVLGAALGVWQVLRHDDRVGPTGTRAPAFQTMTMSSLVSAEGISSPELSADGRYLAYVSGRPGERSLWMRQVATGSQVRVAGPAPDLGNVSFSPDGDYVFFGRRDPDTPNYTAIFSVPTLGGTPRKRIFDVDSAVSPAPDGRRVCFRRGVPQESRDELVIADLETGQERVLASVDGLPGYEDAQWSPDGGRVAATITRLDQGLHCELVIYQVESGADERIGGLEGILLNDIAWLPDGRELVGVGFDTRGMTESQIWRIPLDRRSPQRVTNDLNEYMGVSVGDGGRTLASVRVVTNADLWSVAADGGSAPRQITFGAGTANSLHLAPLPDGAILYVQGTARDTHVWHVMPDGSDRRQVTAEGGPYYDPMAVANRVVVGRIGEDLVPHIWRMAPDGSELVQITEGNGEFQADLSRDGQTVLFTRTEDLGTLWTVPVEGGEPTRVATGMATSGGASFSPDGHWISCGRLGEQDGRFVTFREIRPAAGGEPAVAFPAVGGSDFEWTPDSKGLTFCRQVNGVGNLYRITPDEPEPVPLTSFENGDALDHEWSPDGTRIVVTRRSPGGVELDVLTPGGEARMIASFPTGQIRATRWLADGRTVVSVYGTSTRDVVLVRDFR